MDEDAVYLVRESVASSRVSCGPGNLTSCLHCHPGRSWIARTVPIRRIGVMQGEAVAARTPRSTAGVRSMRKIEERGEVDLRRRSILGKAALAIAAAQFGALRTAAAQTGGPRSPTAANPRAAPSFGSLKQIDAGVLNVGYAEAGPPTGRPSSCCTAGPMTSTAMSMSRRCWLGWLSGDRAVSARLRHHALSVERHRPKRPAIGPRSRHHRADGRAQDREGDPRRLRLGRTHRQHHRGALAGTLQGDGLRERLSDRQPGSQQGAAAAEGRARNGGTSTTSPPNAAGPATRRTGAISRS